MPLFFMTEENKLYYDLLTEQCRINTDEIIENPPVAISMGETTINTIKGKTTIPTSLGTYGNFSFVVAPPKSFKTYFISLLASVYLSGKNRFAGNLRGHRENKCLIHFDTEQGKFHAQRVFRRVVDMNDGDDVGCYHTYGLRTIGYKFRLEFIEYYLTNWAGVLPLGPAGRCLGSTCWVPPMAWRAAMSCNHAMVPDLPRPSCSEHWQKKARAFTAPSPLESSQLRATDALIVRRIRTNSNDNSGNNDDTDADKPQGSKAITEQHPSGGAGENQHGIFKD